MRTLNLIYINTADLSVGINEFVEEIQVHITNDKVIIEPSTDSIFCQFEKSINLTNKTDEQIINILFPFLSLCKNDTLITKQEYELINVENN